MEPYQVVPTDVLSSNGAGGEPSLPVADGRPTDHNDDAQQITNTAGPARLNRYYGALLGILSAFLYSLQSLCMKISTATVNPALLIVVMSPVMLIGSLLYLIYNGVPLPGKRNHYIWLLLTSLATSACDLMFSFALSNADVGDVVTITYTSLILVAILAWLMLGETFGLFGLVMTLTTLVGVVFISRPPFIFGTFGNGYQSTLIGIGFALGTAVALSFIITSMRNHAILGINAFHTMFCNSLLLIAVGVIFCTVTSGWHCLSLVEWVSSLSAGVCYFGGQTLCLFALKYEKALVVNIVLTLEILFAFLLQVLILKVPSPWTSYVGSVLTGSACIGITLKRGMKKSTNSDPGRLTS